MYPVLQMPFRIFKLYAASLTYIPLAFFPSCFFFNMSEKENLRNKTGVKSFHLFVVLTQDIKFNEIPLVIL